MKSLRLPFLLMSLLLGFFACKKDDNPNSTLAREFTAEVPLAWYSLFQDIDRYSPGYRPPAAARMLAYIGLAGYEAAVPGMPDYNSFDGKFAGLNLPAIETGQQYHWPTAVNAAYHESFEYFYPHIQQAHLDKIHHLGEGFEDDFSGKIDKAVFDRSKAFGEAVADLCHKGRPEFLGTPRSFQSFNDMAVENAYSRIPLGVHFRMDCDEGLRLGYLAGQRVLELPWKK